MYIHVCTCMYMYVHVYVHMYKYVATDAKNSLGCCATQEVDFILHVAMHTIVRSGSQNL